MQLSFSPHRRAILLMSAALVLLGAPHAAAQGTVDGRFVTTIDDGTFTVQLQVKASPGTSDIGTSTVQFTYDEAALTYVSGTYENYDGSRPSYTGGTATYSSTITRPTGSKVSLNIVYSGSTDGKGQALPEAWTDVATLQFTVVDPSATAALQWSTTAIFTAGGAQYTNGTFQTDNTVLPVELTAFHAVVDGGALILRWETASETNNAGFAVEHKQHGTFHPVGFVEGAGTTLDTRRYHFRIDQPQPGRHVFRLKQVDHDGQFEYSPEIETVVEMPHAYVLESPYPNPFSTETTVSFSVRESRHVRVEVYDALGRRMQVLYDGTIAGGEATSVRLDGTTLADGMYFVRLSGAGIHALRQIMLVR